MPARDFGSVNAGPKKPEPNVCGKRVQRLQHREEARRASSGGTMVELSDFRPTFTPAVAAELIGSFLLLFLSGASAATAADNGLAAAALGYGLSLAILIYSTAHISGGHLNPAITAGYMAVSAHGFTTRKTKNSVCYWMYGL